MPDIIRLPAAYAAWPGGAIVQQAVGQLAWSHSPVLLTKLKTLKQALSGGDDEDAA